MFCLRFVIPANLFYFGNMGLIIYRSSAGSGKTYTLVTQFLAIVLNKPTQFRRILAITFTNKASEELKTRIIRELDKLATGEPSKHLEEIKSMLKQADETVIRQNAGKVIQNILHDYSSFAVSTIDSYFQQLARVLARELDLPMNYEIELDSESISRNVTELLLDEAGKNHDATGWMKDLLFHQINNDKSWNIRVELRKMAAQLLKSGPTGDYSSNLEPQRLIKLIEFINEGKAEFENHLRKYGEEALKIMSDNGVSADEFSYKSSGPAGYLLKLLNLSSNLKSISTPNSYVSNALKNPLDFLNSGNRNNPFLVEVAEKLHIVLNKAHTYVEENIRFYLTVVELMKLIYQAGISNYLNHTLKQYRADNHLFHLSDTTRMLSEAIGEQDAPFIFEKSGNTYLHVFIDEFQDTSTEQWQILRPLVINTLASGNKVILVGDAKQSIYRFRGGDMQLILEGVRLQLAKRNFNVNEKILDTNYRSKKEIVYFNNQLFPEASVISASQFSTGNEIFTSAYKKEGVEQKISDKSQGGYVKLDFIDKKSIDPETYNHIRQKLPLWKKKALQDMAAEMNELLEKGYHPGDMTILVRTNEHENEIAGYLLNHTSIPFLSSNALLLKTNRKVQLLLACLRLINDPSEVLLYAEINRFTDSESEDPPVPFEKIRLSNTNNSWAAREIASKRDKLISLPLQLSVAHLLDITGSDLSDPYIHRFLDIMQDYVTANGNNLSGFLNWWDEHADTRNWSVEAADAGDAVRIMTVHRSKGLEFPVVFIPFFDWSLKPKSGTILWAKGDVTPFDAYGHLPVYIVNQLDKTFYSSSYQSELRDFYLDTLNLIYVAFTRPVDKLFISIPDVPESAEAGKLVLDVIEKIPEWKEMFDANDRRRLCFGTNSEKTEEKKNTDGESIYVPSPFTSKKSPAVPASSILLPSLNVDFEQEEAVLGNIIHEVMSISNKKEDIKTATERIILRNGYEAYRGHKDRIVNEAAEIMDLLDSMEWNGSHFRVLNESEFFDDQGKVFRPDKVLINKSTTIVADFKTGKRKERYNKQVKAYCDVLRNSGFGNPEGYIIYTSEKEIVKVA